MAYDYLPKEATDEATEERDNLRIARYECEVLEVHLQKGFTPLNIKNISADVVRKKHADISREIREVSSEERRS